VGTQREALLERVAVWQHAGLLTTEQVDAIAAFEQEHGPERAGTAVRTGRDRSTAAEAIGYVGAALVFGAVGLFVAEFWEVLAVGGQLALAVLVTLAAAGAAAALHRSGAPAIVRLTSVLATGTVVGLAWTTSIVVGDLLDGSYADVALAVGLVAVLAAAPLHVLRPRALPQLTVLGSLLVLLSAVLERADVLFGTFWVALPFAALGVVWLLLGEGGYLRPKTIAATAGAALALLALQVASVDEHRLLALVLALTVAGALVALAVTGGGLHHLAVGALGLFVLVPQLVFELFGDAIGAPATLLLVGVLLVLLAVGLGRVRREVLPTGGAS
jgi:hypothetical protein